MKIPTISVVFDRKKTATEKNAALIQIQIYKSREERRYYSTGIKVFLNQFNSNAWVHNRSDALELNKK